MQCVISQLKILLKETEKEEMESGGWHSPTVNPDPGVDTHTHPDHHPRPPQPSGCSSICIASSTPWPQRSQTLTHRPLRTCVAPGHRPLRSQLLKGHQPRPVPRLNSCHSNPCPTLLAEFPSIPEVPGPRPFPTRPLWSLDYLCADHPACHCRGTGCLGHLRSYGQCACPRYVQSGGLHNEGVVGSEVVGPQSPSCFVSPLGLQSEG